MRVLEERARELACDRASERASARVRERASERTRALTSERSERATHRTHTSNAFAKLNAKKEIHLKIERFCKLCKLRNSEIERFFFSNVEI